jgi:hydrogenase nickel incorporation protein HypA/HybF
MHELSVCYALLESVERIVAERNANSVTAIVLKIGPLSGIEVPLLQRAYPLAAKGTVAESAELVFESGDVVVRCNECGSETTVPANRLLCSSCGDFRTQLVSGDEMLLQRVELSGPNIRPSAAAAPAN